MSRVSELPVAKWDPELRKSLESSTGNGSYKRDVEPWLGKHIGLGLLDIETVLEPGKVLHELRAHDRLSDTMVAGYEMHIGCTAGACGNPQGE